MILVGSVGFCLAGEGGPAPRDASGKKSPLKSGQEILEAM